MEPKLQSGSNLQRLKALSVELRELDLGSQVQRVAWPLTPLQFYRDFVSKNKPCVITGAIDHWPALSLWNRDYLADKLQAKQVTVAVTPDGRADAVSALHQTAEADGPCHGKDRKLKRFMLPLLREMPFTAFLDQLTSQHLMTAEKSAASSANNTHAQQVAAHLPEVLYIQQQDNNFIADFPELTEDVDEGLPWACEAFGMPPEAVNLWIGDDQSVTSFHKDHYENLYAVITGEKIFTLLPPCDSFRMQLSKYSTGIYEEGPNGLQAVPYQGSDIKWSPIEDLASDPNRRDLQQYPLYSDPDLPKPMRVRLRPGELLYLPSMWWHQVEQRAGRNGLVIAVNYWYDMQFDCKYAYFNLVESMRCSKDTHEGVPGRKD